MTLALLGSLVGIAALDSLNPSLFIGQLYLLTTPKPVPRMWMYIAGIVAVYFVGGMLLLGGFREMVSPFLESLSPDTLRIGQIIIGVLAVGFGLWMKTDPAEAELNKTPKSLNLWAAFAFGIAVNINELTTALPYFVAIEQMSQAQLTFGQAALAMLIYNAVFALPLIGVTVLYAIYGDRFKPQIERISAWVRVWTPRLIKYAALLFGAYLLIDALIVQSLA